MTSTWNPPTGRFAASRSAAQAGERGEHRADRGGRRRADGRVGGPDQAGTCRLTLGAWSWAGIAGILATFDADFTELRPPELAAACRRLAGRLSPPDETD